MGKRAYTLQRVRGIEKACFSFRVCKHLLTFRSALVFPGFSCLQMQAVAVAGLSLSSLPLPAALAGPSVLPRAQWLPTSMRLVGAAKSFQAQGQACLPLTDECKNLLLGLKSFPEESRLTYLISQVTKQSPILWQWL